ncbi:hypothetical protein D3C71_1511150 [compost metagenome]
MGYTGQHETAGMLQLMKPARHFPEGAEQLMDFPFLRLRIQRNVVAAEADLGSGGGHPLDRAGQLAGQQIDRQPA